MTEHKETCVKINGDQTVELTKGSIKFKRFSKQLPLPFKIYAYFECNVKRIKSSSEMGNNASYNEKYQDHIPCCFAYKVVCVDDKVNKPIILYRGENAVNEFIEAIRKEYEYCKKVIKKYFNKI